MLAEAIQDGFNSGLPVKCRIALSAIFARSESYQKTLEQGQNMAVKYLGKHVRLAKRWHHQCSTDGHTRQVCQLPSVNSRC